MEKTTFSSMTKAKKLLAFLLAVVLVLAMPGSVWAGPGDGGSSGPGGGGSSGPGGGGSEYNYDYSIRPTSGSYSFDYQKCVYTADGVPGDAAVVTAMVRPALADDKTIGFNYSGEDMKWSIDTIQNDEYSSTVVFRGETNTSLGNVLDETSGTLKIEVLDKSYDGTGTKNVYGVGTISINLYNSLSSSTVTLDANGGKLEVTGEGGNVSTVDSYDVTVATGGSFEAGVLDTIVPVYEDGSKLFVGWQRDGDSNIYENIPKSNPMQKSVYSLMFRGDTTLKAVWEDAIEVKYVTNRGNITTAEYMDGTSAKVEGNTATFYTPAGKKSYFIVTAEDDEYLFSGWESSTGKKYGAYGTQGIEYSANETYTALWSKPINFTFISDVGYIDGEADKTQKVVSVPEGQKLGYMGPTSRAPQVTGRDGYVFISWVEQDSKVEYTAEDMKYIEKTAALYDGKDKTFVAKWAIDWEFVSYIKEPTCTEAGIMLQKSNAPGSTQTRQVPAPAKGHTPVIDEGKAPSKTSVGWTTGSHCSVCGTVLKARTQIPMLKEDSSGKLGGQKGSGSTGKGSGSKGTSSGAKGSGSGSAAGTGTASGSGSSASAGSDSSKPKYSSEWVDGKWYNEDGTCTYTGELKWYSNSTGWWAEDTDGWYPTNQWQKIDGTWYFFNASGYMASSEWYNGYWFNSDGAWDSTYKMTWKNNATGWWIEDITGWWPSSSWQKIDGSWYYFESSGYMAASKYVGGYWVGDDGVCQ